MLTQLGGNETQTSRAPSDSSRGEDTSMLSRVAVFENLEANIAAKDWKATEAMIQRVLRASPSWMSRYRQEFDLLHIRYYLESGNFPSASSLIRIYMGSDIQSARELANLANEYEAKGLEKEREFLIQQIQRKFPKMKL